MKTAADKVCECCRYWSELTVKSHASNLESLCLNPKGSGGDALQMKTLANVATEMALHVLAYNMKRVMRILGVSGLMAAMRA